MWNWFQNIDKYGLNQHIKQANFDMSTSNNSKMKALLKKNTDSLKLVLCQHHGFTLVQKDSL